MEWIRQGSLHEEDSSEPRNPCGLPGASLQPACCLLGWMMCLQAWADSLQARQAWAGLCHPDMQRKAERKESHRVL
jgi:hypothetical protein